MAFGGDTLLRSISDWKFFEERMKSYQDLQYPHKFITQKLITDEWKNIPIPLLEAFEIIKKTFF